MKKCRWTVPVSSGGGDGLMVCPACNKRRLPVIAPGSIATAVACQNCSRVVERAEQVELLLEAERAAQELKSKPPKPPEKPPAA